VSISQERWRLLPYSEGRADEELAAAEAMLAGLAHAATPAVRWYGARCLALVIGSGQRPTEVDGEALAAAGGTLHKRASGGTAVLFVPGFLMQDIALPAGHPLRRDDVSESYAWLGAVWAEALGELGVAAEPLSIAAARADSAAADPLVRRACFGGRSPYEVLAGGRKLVGFSQIRRRPGALLQVGVYARWPGRELAALLRAPDAEREALAAGLAGRVAGLDELHPTPPAPAAVMDAFARALARRHGVELAADEWRPDEEAALAAALARYAPIDPAATLPATPSS
jgi:lipoate-protein ligase A